MTSGLHLAGRVRLIEVVRGQDLGQEEKGVIFLFGSHISEGSQMEKNVLNEPHEDAQKENR